MGKKSRRIKNLKKNQKRGDSWQNNITSLNTSKDRKTANQVKWRQLTEDEASHLYAGDKTSAKIVNAVPDEMFKNGFNVTHSNGNANLNQMTKDRLDELDAISKFKDAIIQARLYGGAGIILGTSEGIESGDYSSKLDEDNLTKVEWLLVANRWQLKKSSMQSDISKPHYGEPLTYMYSDGGSSFEVHRSRILFFHGVHLPRYIYKQNGYWHDSVLNNLKNSVSNFNQTHDTVATVLTEMLMTSFNINGLTEMLSQGQKEVVQERIELINLYRSALNMVILSDDEKLSRETLNLSGISDLIKQVNNKLVADTDLPHTVILGESPGGLGSNGKSEMTSLYDKAKAAQENQYKPPLERLIGLIYKSKNDILKGEEPSGWGLKFEPINVPTQVETLEMRDKQSQIDERYYNMAALESDEIREQRFGTGQYSFETNIKSDEAVLEELIKYIDNPAVKTKEGLQAFLETLGVSPEKASEVVGDLIDAA